jgi:tripartite-type tricarboxylate transporter receptor subunit TctC
MGSRLRGNDGVGIGASSRLAWLIVLAAINVFASSLAAAQPASTEPVLSLSKGSGQAYPTKPIRLLTAEVGGGSDFSARLLSQRLTESLGQQIVVDNRTGGVIIGDIASKAQPDGYTLMLYSSALWLMPFMRSHVPYRMEQFVPVIYISASPLILVVHPSVAAKSTEELIALAKAKPGDLNYASGPLGASPHLAGELFKYMTGTNIVHIPFKGVGLALNDVIAGRVHIMFTSVGGAVPQIKAGRLRALAVTTAQPSPLLPQLPTVASAAGLAGFESVSTNGLFTPAKTPPAVIARLNRDINAALQRPDLRDKFMAVGMELVGGTPAHFAEVIRVDTERMSKVIKAAGLRAE